MFDLLSGKDLAVEYDDDTRQWYFIAKDSRTQCWVATKPVPSSYGLGRQSIHPSTVKAAEVDDE